MELFKLKEIAMKKLIIELEKFKPSCEQEEVDKKLFLDCIKVYKEKCLTRENLLCHFATGAFVINKDKNKAVFAFHKIYNSWAWLGGHADGDDDLLHVDKKEIEEECGLTNIKLFKRGIYSLESLPVKSHFKNGKFVPAHVHLNVTYAFIANEDETLIIADKENSGVEWMNFDDILERSTEPHMISVYQKVINKVKNNSKK